VRLWERDRRRTPMVADTDSARHSASRRALPPRSC